MGGASRGVRLLACGVLATAAAACAQTDSKNVRTGGIDAQIEVRVSGDGSGFDVDATLSLSATNSVDLSGDDELTATAGGRTRTLQHREVLKQDVYTAHFEGDATPGTPVTVALRRGSKDESAPKSVVRLPDRLSVSAPAAGSTHRRDADLLIATNRASGGLSVAWKGSCVQPDSVTADAGDPLVIEARRMFDAPAPSATGQATSRTCVVALTISRIRTGELDDAYDEGSIRAFRPVTVAIRSAP